MRIQTLNYFIKIIQIDARFYLSCTIKDLYQCVCINIINDVTIMHDSLLCLTMCSLLINMCM